MTQLFFLIGVFLESTGVTACTTSGPAVCIDILWSGTLDGNNAVGVNLRNYTNDDLTGLFCMDDPLRFDTLYLRQFYVIK